MRFLIYQIGCIECGVPSYPIGIVDTKEEAQEILSDYPSTWDMYGGDGYIDIIDLKKVSNTRKSTIKSCIETIEDKIEDCNVFIDHSQVYDEPEFTESNKYLYDQYTGKKDKMNKAIKIFKYKI